MALNVGDNTYVTLAEAQEYTTNVGSGATISEGSLRRAFAYIESHRDEFRGTKFYNEPKDFDKPQWPRAGVVIDGIDVPAQMNVAQPGEPPQLEDFIPQLIKDAQIEAAIEFASGNDPLLAAQNRVLIRERYGDVEFQYADRYASPPDQAVVLRRVEAILAPALEYGGMQQPILVRGY